MGAFTNILLPDRGSGEGEMTEAVFSWGGRRKFLGVTTEVSEGRRKGVFGY
jgi:hypothetical protein